LIIIKVKNAYYARDSNVYKKKDMALPKALLKFLVTLPFLVA